MVVTINTDASWHSALKVGAFAFWIVSNKGRVLKCGAFKNQVSNSSKAEAQCIINALHALKEQKWNDIKLAVINTDSKNAIAIFTKDKAEIKRWKLQWGDPLRKKFEELKAGLGKVDFRYVPAHKNIKDSKTWVNDWCDKKAKEMLWKEINSNKINLKKT